MIGPGGMVLPNAGSHGIDVPPGHDGIDEAVASPSGEVVLLEAEGAEVVGVVRESQISGGEGSRQLARRCGVPVQDHGDFRCQYGAFSEDPVRTSRVLDGDEVRMRSGGSIPGQLKHPRAKRGEDPAVLRHGRTCSTSTSRYPSMWA